MFGNCIQHAKVEAGGHQECLGPVRPGRPSWEEPGLHPKGSGEPQRSVKEHTPGQISSRVSKLQGVGALQQVMPTWPPLPREPGHPPGGLRTGRGPSRLCA